MLEQAQEIKEKKTEEKVPEKKSESAPVENTKTQTDENELTKDNDITNDELNQEAQKLVQQANDVMGQQAAEQQPTQVPELAQMVPAEAQPDAP